MIVVRPTHVIQCTPEKFWELYFDPDFERTLFVDGLGWSEPQVDVLLDNDETLERTVEAFPKLILPGGITRLIKKALGYTERGRLDRKSETYHLRHTTNLFGDKLDLGGRFYLEPVGETACRRHGIIEIEAHVFGLAKVIEKAVEFNVNAGWTKSANFLNQHFAKNPPESRR